MILTYWEIQKTIDLIEQEQIKVASNIPTESDDPRSAIADLHDYNGTQTLANLQDKRTFLDTSESKRLKEYKEKLEGLMSELTFDLSRREGEVSTIT